MRLNDETPRPADREAQVQPVQLSSLGLTPANISKRVKDDHHNSLHSPLTQVLLFAYHQGLTAMERHYSLSTGMHSSTPSLTCEY